MKKILYIADTFPFPYNSGGKLRTANIMKQLAKKYDIDFITYSTEPIEQERIMQAYECCRHVECFYEGIPSKKKRICNFLKMKSNKAFVVYSKHMQQAIDNLITNNEYSLIMIERLYCYPYIEKYFKKPNFKTPVFINMHDIEQETILNFRRYCSSIIKKIYYSIEYFNVISLEKKAISTVTRMIAVSELDMEYYIKKYPFWREKWIYINNGADIDIAKNEPIAQRDPKTILFLGSLTHSPNMNGLEWFVNKIWENVISKEKDAKILVVGSGEVPNEFKKMLNNKEGVEYLGYVENIYPLLRKCTCLIVPLLSGSGTRLKILDAFSCKLPVISTTIGAEGLPVINGIHLLIADQEMDISNRIIEMLHSDDLRTRLAENGYELVCKEYDWQLIGEKLIKEIENISH